MTIPISKIQFLREQLASSTPVPKRLWPFSLWPNGIPQGVLWELSAPLGHGKMEVALRFLSENKSLRGVWIEESLGLYPPSLAWQKLSLFSLLLVEAGPDLFWASLQVIQSQVFQVVVIYNPRLSEKQLRQLQLTCRRHSCTIILLTNKPSPRASWPIYLRHQVDRQQDTDLLKLTRQIKD